MIGLPTLIIGLIFVVAGSTWFTNASTVGWILIGVSSALIALKIGLLLLAGWAALKR